MSLVFFLSLLHYVRISSIQRYPLQPSCGTIVHQVCPKIYFLAVCYTLGYLAFLDIMVLILVHVVCIAKLASNAYVHFDFTVYFKGMIVYTCQPLG